MRSIKRYKILKRERIKKCDGNRRISRRTYMLCSGRKRATDGKNKREKRGTESSSVFMNGLKDIQGGYNIRRCWQKWHLNVIPVCYNTCYHCCQFSSFSTVDVTLSPEGKSLHWHQCLLCAQVSHERSPSPCSTNVYKCRQKTKQLNTSKSKPMTGDMRHGENCSVYHLRMIF